MHQKRCCLDNRFDTLISTNISCKGKNSLTDIGFGCVGYALECLFCELR